MGLLEAARASVLGLPKDSAFSWGLNRAIFFAAAKRGFKSGGGSPSSLRKFEVGAKESEKTSKDQGMYYLGDDKAYVDKEASSKDRPLFTIGGETQTEESFMKQIASRFGGKSNFEKAWNEALKIVEEYDEKTLKSGREFYENVYKPRRDVLAKKWTEAFAEPKKAVPTASSKKA